MDLTEEIKEEIKRESEEYLNEIKSGTDQYGGLTKEERDELGAFYTPAELCIQANLKNNIDWNKKGLPMHGFYFEKAFQKNNFSNWWYSCNSNQSGKKSRIGLTNFILSILRDARSANGGGYDEFFPNIDWSHPWTDKEILKEIGLPEDFLEED